MTDTRIRSHRYFQKLARRAHIQRERQRAYVTESETLQQSLESGAIDAGTYERRCTTLQHAYDDWSDLGKQYMTKQFTVIVVVALILTAAIYLLNNIV